MISYGCGGSGDKTVRVVSDRSTLSRPTVPNQYALEVVAFARAVSEPRPSTPPVADGLRSVKVRLAALEPARTGRAGPVT
jgi:predicted dehydrogenase